MPRKPTKPAKPAPKPRTGRTKAPAKPAPAPAPIRKVPKAKPRAKDLSIDELLDDTPPPAIPGVYMGIADGINMRGCIAYKRDENHVWTVMLNDKVSTERTLRRWGADTFDKAMQRARYPHLKGPYHSLERALQVFMNPEALYGPGAYRVLSKLAKGQDPTVEDTIDDLLDMTPSDVAPKRPSRRTLASKEERKTKRQARLSAMNPAELRAWRDKRNARRKMRRIKAKNEGS